METPALNAARQFVFTCEGIISSSILFFFQYGIVRFIVYILDKYVKKPTQYSTSIYILDIS